MSRPRDRYAHPRNRVDGWLRRKKKVADAADVAAAEGTEASSRPTSTATDSAVVGSLPSASPAPFLKTLKPTRPPASSAASASPATASAATTPRSAGRSPAPPSDDEADALSEAAISDESFESATTVVPRSALAHRDVERDDDTPIGTLKPPPSLDEMVAKIAPETRNALEQLFRARFRAVRRITPSQLR